MNPNPNDFHNNSTQPLNHQFIDYNAHTTVNHTNPFPNTNINFTADANYAPPSSDMNQNFQPQPQQQGFIHQQPQYQVNQGFQTGFPNTTVQMNSGPQVTFGTQPNIQVIQPGVGFVQQPSIQVVSHQPGFTMTTGTKVNNVVVMGGGINTYPTVTIPVGVNQNAAARMIMVFVFFFIFFIFIRIMTAFSRF